MNVDVIQWSMGYLSRWNEYPKAEATNPSEVERQTPLPPVTRRGQCVRGNFDVPHRAWGSAVPQ